MIEIILSQLIALLTFFAFPIFQYFILKKLTKKECNPELWYLPDFGFRLVIRNLPGKRFLTDIKYKSFLREVVKAEYVK